MFVDQVRIKVIAGAGGNGCCSFRREKYVAHGGPDGGDGGDGGDVHIIADSRLTSLLDVRYHSQWKGKRGAHGKGSDMHGKRGEDTIIPVPPGTLVRDWETGEILSDLCEEDERFLAAAGKKGGRGNARFTTPVNRVPRFAELGEPSEEKEFLLELKLIAEVGIVGLPNAGKSTLLSRVSAAHPKIADYPFTTLSPNLGVAQIGDYRTLTFADIPGIIEGAAQGKGLGHDFLRHVERTKVLLFLVDASEGDPIETIETLEGELAQHSPVFETRPRLIALSKADLPQNRQQHEALPEELGEVHLISSATGEGVHALLEALWKAVEQVRKEEAGIVLERPPEVEYTYAAPYTVDETPEGFHIEGDAAVRAVKMTDFSNEEAVRHLQSRLEKMGLFKALKRMGAKDGQSILIGGVELEYRDD